MDPGLLEETLAARARAGKLPKAMVPVHFYGQSADMDPILAACARYGVPVIEDAAEALGATYKGRSPGTFGMMGAFSFNGNKFYADTIGDPSTDSGHCLPGIRLMPEAPWGRATHWLSAITVDPAQFGATREQIREALDAQDIESRPLWKPMHLQPVFQGYEAVGGAVAEALFRDGLCLPSGTALTEAEVAGVVREKVTQ